MCRWCKYKQLTLSPMSAMRPLRALAHNLPITKVIKNSGNKEPQKQNVASENHPGIIVNIIWAEKATIDSPRP